MDNKAADRVDATKRPNLGDSNRAHTKIGNRADLRDRQALDAANIGVGNKVATTNKLVF